MTLWLICCVGLKLASLRKNGKVEGFTVEQILFPLILHIEVSLHVMRGGYSASENSFIMFSEALEELCQASENNLYDVTVMS